MLLAATVVPITPDVQASEPAAIQVGEPFPQWELSDQFDETHRLPGESADAIVFVRSKQADESLAPVLESVVGERLSDGEVVYVSDISGMPGLITRLFALPALRDRGYPVVLIREEGLSRPLATREDCLVRYRIEQGKVVAIDHLCEPAAIERAF
jgi:hypothetical protein